MQVIYLADSNVSKAACVNTHRVWGFRLHGGIRRFRVTAFISLKPMKQSCDDECRRCSVTVINRRDFLIILLVSQLDKLRQNKIGFDLWISELNAGQALLYFGSFEIVWLVGVLFWVVLLDNVYVFLSDCICVRVRQCEFACPSAHVRICGCLWTSARVCTSALYVRCKFCEILSPCSITLPILAEE